MPMLRGFRWYPYFVAQEQLVAFEASKSRCKNHDYKLYKRVFRVAVNTYVPIFQGLDARGGRKLRTDTHRHMQDNHSNNNLYSKH